MFSSLWRTSCPPQVKGKAAIDVLGARLGKSGGALAQQGLVVACGSIITGAPVLATLFALVRGARVKESWADVLLPLACTCATLIFVVACADAMAAGMSMVLFETVCFPGMLEPDNLP